MTKASLIKELDDILSKENLSGYNLFEVYSLVFDINTILLEEGDIMSLFPQNNKLGDALAGEKYSEIQFGEITSTLSENDYSSIHSVFLARVQGLSS